MTKPEVRIETELGPSVATDDGAGYWQITDSWGDQRFHGTRAQVRAKMRERIRLNAAESDTIEAGTLLGSAAGR